MMELFYERLWSSDDPVSRIDALRQAQLTMLRGDQVRGLGIVARGAGQGAPRRPPAEWAAFVLSGDWR
jgi:CHAT domain-containing protein